MTTKATFYHAGCPGCLSAEQQPVTTLDPSRVVVETVPLGTAQNRVAEAERAGVKSVPALVLDGQVFHTNYGAALSDLK